MSKFNKVQKLSVAFIALSSTQAVGNILGSQGKSDVLLGSKIKLEQKRGIDRFDSDYFIQNFPVINEVELGPSDELRVECHEEEKYIDFRTLDDFCIDLDVQVSGTSPINIT